MDRPRPNPASNIGVTDCGQAHIGLGRGVGAIRNQGWTLELPATPCADYSGDPVADESDHPGSRQDSKLADRLRIDESFNRRLPRGKAANEDLLEDTNTTSWRTAVAARTVNEMSTVVNPERKRVGVSSTRSHS